MPQLNLEISNRFEDGLADPESAATTLFRTLEVSGRFPIGDGDLSIVFVSDEEIARVHDDFMDDPTPTDVITFPADPEMESAGEIIVSVDHARQKAEELGEPFSRELSLYLVHGWLHLAGYDDRNETDRAAMRQAEQEALALLDAAAEPIDFKLTSV
ncbi:rRNA maturation RNase YbeY [Coraliomargarita parva]|uniref:rRNA maturation RNase YbeY n=1 Tax=Coraliomargarita parva TaxID=3014050 RepID=UPI0022B3F9D5|nr:rRNA maturation RNase YbeY [Coraliomargarita parva]